MRIYITGKIAGTTKSDLKEILEEHGHVYDTFTKHTDLLVLGERAGPKKLEKARSWGIRVLSWEDFVDEYGIEYSSDELS